MVDHETHVWVEDERPVLGVRRVFEALRGEVYEALTRPDLVAQWYAPEGFTITSAEMEAQPGRWYRIVQRSPDGDEYAFHGIFQEVVPDERLVYTLFFEGRPGDRALVTDTLEQNGTATIYTTVMEFDCEDARQRYLAAEGEDGLAQVTRRLEEVILSLPA